MSTQLNKSLSNMNNDSTLRALKLRRNEIRRKLAKLQGMSELTEDQANEADSLLTEYRSVELQVQAGEIAGQADDDSLETRSDTDGEGEGEDETRADDGGEVSERDDLITRSRVSEIVNHVAQGGRIDGATAELQQELNLQSNQVPLDLLRELETRQVSTAPANVGRRQQSLLMPVFATGDAAYLNIPRPTVPVGESVYPVLTSRPTVHGPYSASEAANESQATFTATVLQPQRIQAAFSYRRVDAARFAGMDSALRSSLSDALSEQLDSYVVGRLLAELAANASAAKVTYDIALQQLGTALPDGRFARRVSEVKSLIGAATYSALSILRSDYDDVLSVLTQRTGGVEISAHIPAVAAKKQEAIIRIGSRQDAVLPIWEGVTLIPDEITRVSKGEVALNAIMLHSWGLLRADGFKRQELQITA